MKLLKLIQQAKEEIDIGSPQKAETLLDLALMEANNIAAALRVANTQILHADPVEAVSTLDLILMNQRPACPTCGGDHPVGCCAQDGHGG
jgi:phosphatidylserine/phosphatidylglycerophosphate/cardiolipin synthase-like enzyme